MPGQSASERVGSKFTLESFLSVQRETFDALRTIARQILPGILESEAYELAKKTLADLGFQKHWHRPYVRFGSNTILMYGKPSPVDLRLGENDVFYLDIGPVKDGIEGDAGDTFLVGPAGKNPEVEKCITDTRLLFEDVRMQWKQHNWTGQKLYAYADECAKKMGWILNHEWNGHRIADFPHHTYSKGSLADSDFVPTAGLWILEVHLCDPEKRFGAFFEDALV